MHSCKLCGTGLVRAYGGTYICGSDLRDGSHDYCFNEYDETEEFSATSETDNAYYAAYIDTTKNTTYIYIAIGQDVKHIATMNTALKIDQTTPEAFIDKIKKLLLLI